MHMNLNNLWLRRLPILLFTVLGTTALIVVNPGYFWDDWVWRYQGSASSIQIGKELGVWWGGYLTNAINGLESPSLTMRVVALLTWLLAGAAAAITLVRLRWLSAAEAFDFFVLYAATHVALVRFLTSLAMSNVYIASFWLACALYVAFPHSRLARLGSLALFFFSFYLNSLLSVYVALLLLWAAMALKNSEVTSPVCDWKHWHAHPNELKAELQSLYRRSLPHLLGYARSNLGLLLLPFVFLLLKRATKVHSAVYGSYNSIDRHQLLAGFSNSFGFLGTVVDDFVSHDHHLNVAVLLATLISLTLLVLCRSQPIRVLSLRPTIIKFCLGWLLFAAAVYPYLLVGKPPEIKSFYESRHILPAIVGLDLVLLALIDGLTMLFSRIRIRGVWVREVLLAYLLGSSVVGGFQTGADLWRDWLRQSEITRFIEQNKKNFAGVHTYIFQDDSRQTRIADRMIWNYEYTGNLISVFNDRSHFGIGMAEYAGLPPGVPLLLNPELNERYNFRDYKFREPHLILTLRPGEHVFTNGQILAIVKSYLLGQYWQPPPGEYLRIEAAYEFQEADDRVLEITLIENALWAYRRDKGRFPTMAPDHLGLPVRQSASKGSVGLGQTLDEVIGLTPEYLPKLPTVGPRPPTPSPYLYLSDGVDFKLVFIRAMDIHYARQAYPELIDPVREGYGVWTRGARNW
jgi:hypothetical protein